MKKFDINQFKPCEDGLEYYNSHPDFETAWNNCERGDWMLWMAKRLNVDDRVFTLARAHCANTVRHLMKDVRSLDAVDAAIKYGNGEISRVDLIEYAIDALSAAVDACAAYAYTYSYTSYYACTASTSASDETNYNSASCAACAVSSDAIDDVCAFDARESNQKETADICRKYLTDEVFNKIKNNNESSINNEETRIDYSH